MPPARLHFAFPSLTFLACLANLGFTACLTNPLGEAPSSNAQPVVYGSDDRTDVYAHPDAKMRLIALKSSVVLVDPKYIDERDPKNVVPSKDTPTLGDYMDLCKSEPFRDDPAMGSCSGALIDDDLVLTAGHCVATARDCQARRFVFGFNKTSSTTLGKLTEDDVYRCTDRLVWKDNNRQGIWHDYAIVKLDRPATPRFQPAAVKLKKSPLRLGQGIGIIGYGKGIPAKIDTGATTFEIRDPELDYFVHTSDAYSGNSGSPVFDMLTHEIAGILVRGQAEDFIEQGNCWVNHVCPGTLSDSGGCTGMESDYAANAVEELCGDTALAARYAHLCGPSQACGNGRCESNEGADTCPVDCGGAPDASSDVAPLLDGGGSEIDSAMSKDSGAVEPRPVDARVETDGNTGAVLESGAPLGDASGDSSKPASRRACAAIPGAPSDLGRAAAFAFVMCFALARRRRPSVAGS